jgi:hypothetical protein
MVYEEPGELCTSDDLDWLFEEHGRVSINRKGTAIRDDLIYYNPEVHAQERKTTFSVARPEEHRMVLRAIIERYFDVFAQECRIT